MEQTDAKSAPAHEGGAPIPFAEFVGLIAAMMTLTALGIDSMMPALPAIADAMHIAHANDRQYIFTAFLVGFGVSQVFYGPLADRFGRKPVLGWALAAYVVFNIAAAAAGSFTMLLVARLLGGMAAGGARVVAVAIVRDCFAGRAMARVMSMAFLVLLAAPVLAPSFGQLILTVAPWRWIFWVLAIVAAATAAWFVIRLPETLPRERRLPIDVASLMRSAGTVVRDRGAVGYTLASGALSGALFGFIGSVQQIVADGFGMPDQLNLMFAGIVSFMAVGSLVNVRMVVRVGMRPISHTALAAFIVVAAVHLAVSESGFESVWTFVVLQGLTQACFVLATSNFSAMAMERMGGVAGMASSLQGLVSTVLGAVIGAVIGQAFDGTTLPLNLGSLAMGLVALGIVFVTERGRMFRPS